MKSDFIESHWTQIGLSFGLLIAYLILREIAKRLIKNHSDKNSFEETRTIYVSKFINFFLSILLGIGLFAVWNLDAKSFLLYFGSFFTVAGVALFAQWSILSNITASVILFFAFPFKIGSRIKIMDDKNSVLGVVHDITFFVIQIRTDEGNIISYPNNLAIQKGIIDYVDYDTREGVAKSQN